jgi:hypothetical protein
MCKFPSIHINDNGTVRDGLSRTMYSWPGHPDHLLRHFNWRTEKSYTNRKEDWKRASELGGDDDRQMGKWEQIIPCTDTYLLTYLLAYSLTHSVQDTIWKADSNSACQTIACFIYGTRRFVFTKARQSTLSWASRIQFTPSIPISIKPILMLSSHLRLGLPRGLLPSGLPTKTL